MSPCDTPASTRILVVDDGRVVTSWPFTCARPPSLCDVDRLARLQLAARRMGLAVVVEGPPTGLVELLDLAGLRSLAAPARGASGLEALGEPEEREQPR